MGLIQIQYKGYLKRGEGREGEEDILNGYLSIINSLKQICVSLTCFKNI